MAIIYTYPRISSLQADDCMLVSDDSDGKKTKSVSLSTIKSFVGGGSAAMLTVQTSNGGTVVNNVTDIKVTGQLTDDGNGVVTITTDAGSGGTPAAPLNSVQFNGNDSFSGSANLTFNGTNKLDVTHMVDIKGDGTNAGKLKLYCPDNTTPHYVELEGPAHGVQGQTNYTIKLPAVAPTDGQILEYVDNTTGYQWKTPTNTGVTETSGTWTPILGTQMGAGYSLEAQGLITQTSTSGSWRRIGHQMYYDFYISFTITSEYLNPADLVIGQAKDTNTTSDVYPLPVDGTQPAVNNPTLVNNIKNNGSCQITQATTDGTSKMWYRMPQTGKVGKTTPGIVDLASHNYDPTIQELTIQNINYLHHVYTQQWWDVAAVNTNNIIAGTIIGVAATAS